MVKAYFVEPCYEMSGIFLDGFFIQALEKSFRHPRQWLFLNRTNLVCHNSTPEPWCILLPQFASQNHLWGEEACKVIFFSSWQGHSHVFEIGGAQASKFILGSF